MSKPSTSLEFLIELTEAPTPTFFRELSEPQLDELRNYIECVVNRDQAGLDRLFESMSMMMKFIPNFILHSITPKYIEPSIAARITNKLTVKQALGVTTGLPIDYIGETAVYLESRHAAEILIGLKTSKIKQVIEYVIDKHPPKALDILEHVPDDILIFSLPFIDQIGCDKACLTSTRREVLAKIERLKRG